MVMRLYEQAYPKGGGVVRKPCDNNPAVQISVIKNRVGAPAEPFGSQPQSNTYPTTNPNLASLYQLLASYTKNRP